MKTAKLKINIKVFGNDFKKGEILSFQNNGYIGQDRKALARSFVEDNPDIFEIYDELESQDMVKLIEDIILSPNRKAEYNARDKAERIIELFNNSVKEEYVRYVTDEGLDTIVKGYVGDCSSHPINEDAFVYKIKIIVEKGDK